MISSLRVKRKLAEFVLSRSNPKKLQKLSESRAVKAFKNLAKTSPRYQEILEMENIAPDNVRDIDDFHQHIPLLTKDRLYSGNSSAGLLNTNNKIPSAITSSSGRGGQYSFAPVSKRQMRKSSAMVDIGLALHFQSDRLKTLVVNCLPMGVFVPSDSNTVINVSVREDTAIAAAERFADGYDQLIFLIDPLFGKKLADRALTSRIDWSKHKIHILCGGETSGENYRRYLAQCFEIDLSDPNTGSVRASMGMGEIGLNLLFETPKTIALKNRAVVDPGVHKFLFGSDLTSAAMLFTFDPARAYLEVVNRDPLGIGDLAISDCDQLSNLPLVRYLSGDRARIAPAKALEDAIRWLNWPKTCFDKLPMMALYGRQSDMLAPTLSVSDIKEGLYAESDTARALTGAFRVKKHKDRLLIDIQLRAGSRSPRPYIEALENRLASYEGGVDIDLVAFEEFSKPGPIDYERKFPYFSGTG